VAEWLLEGTPIRSAPSFRHNVPRPQRSQYLEGQRSRSLRWQALKRLSVSPARTHDRCECSTSLHNRRSLVCCIGPAKGVWRIWNKGECIGVASFAGRRPKVKTPSRMTSRWILTQETAACCGGGSICGFLLRLTRDARLHHRVGQAWLTPFGRGSNPSIPILFKPLLPSEIVGDEVRSVVIIPR